MSTANIQLLFIKLILIRLNAENIDPRQAVKA